MKAMIFAAGLGTRLRPLTDTMPKALIDINGKPALERVILKLKAVGVDEMVVNVHHFADQIVDFLQAHDNFGVDIAISDERGQLLDTGGGILAARRWLDCGEPFIVHNADIMTDFDVAAMYESHKHSGADVTLLTQRRQSSRYLYFDSGGRMRGWGRADGSAKIPEELDTENLTGLGFGGVSVVSTGVFPLLEAYASRTPVFSTTPFYATNCNALDIRSYTPGGVYRWVDIGKPETLALARELWR